MDEQTQAQRDQADLAATNDTVMQPEPETAETQVHTGADAHVAEVQTRADLAANSATANGLSVAMQHTAASAGTQRIARDAAQGDGDITEGLDLSKAASLDRTLPAQAGEGSTRREPTNATHNALVNGGTPPVNEDGPEPGTVGVSEQGQRDIEQQNRLLARGSGIHNGFADPTLPQQDPNPTPPDATREGRSNDSVADVAKGTAHEGVSTQEADAVAAQQNAQSEAGSVAGVGGPAPTPESLGEVDAEGNVREDTHHNQR